MGNIGSQTGHITSHQHQRPVVVEEQQWAHSFPRTQPRLHQNKVLPERDARQKLRHTNNGEILQSGGTLSGRQHQSRLSLERDDDSPVEDYAPQRPRTPPPRTYLPNQRDPLHKSGSRYTQAMDYNKHFQNGFNHQAYRENMKKFGSEPDLRQSKMSSETQEINRMRAKKKYKAPPPPNIQMDNWEDNSSGDNGPSIRKARLFKTRAETKKNYSSPVNNHKSLETRHENEDVVQMRERERSADLRSNRLSLPEMKITENLHQELKEVTKRLRHTRTTTESNVVAEINNKNVGISKEKLKTLDHNINRKENIRQKLKQITAEENKKNFECIRGDGSGKESSTPEQSSPIIRNNSKETPKTFYFGMDDNNVQGEDFHNELVDHFASNLHQMVHVPKVANSSESDLSSEIEIDENQSRSGIDLQLRPILPKKQLEIPRFSPAAAWRLLSAVDSNPGASTIASDDVPIFIEDRIEKYSRPPPPTMQIGPRSNDKSGDSGISGDAGPTGYDDPTEVILNSRNTLPITQPANNRAHGISWTPQQDLGDDSSMEEGLNNDSSNYKPRQAKFSNKPHVFSLSLPRDNHLSSYMADKYQYTGLQKLKRSVSGVLGTLGSKKDLLQPNLTQDQSDNWFLSKSAPNSLNNGFNSLELKASQKSDENKEQLLINANNKSSGRLMYLPEFETNQDHRSNARSKTKDDYRERSKSAERSKNVRKLSVFSKSCENINGEVKSSSEPEDLQDPPKIVEERAWKSGRKNKRFTFQSTVRQIERKRLAEKLSREAEKKEKQRLRELEAMQKVEEEFQKKRAREKATIRQQLRLFSMDDVQWAPLSPNVDPKEEVRPEPDGAVSSSATSSPSLPPVHKSETSKKVYQKNKKLSSNVYHNKHRPSSESSEDTRGKAHVTQVLSEYRHPQREYKDYTGSTRYLNETDNHQRHTTVHPQVTCNMPKAKGQSSNKTSGTNYRKDFAHGVKSTRSAGGSTYSEDSQSRNNSPRMYHNKYAPITRF